MKIGKYILLCVTVFAMLFSCEQEEPVQVQGMSGSQFLSNTNNAQNNFIAAPAPQCTLVSADWAGLTIAKGEQRTFEIQYYEGAIYKWTVSGSISIVSGVDSHRVTVIGSYAGSGTLSVTMDYPPDASVTCGRTGSITVGSGTGTGTNPPLCNCPEPKITATLCVSGGHPDWRFEVTNYTNTTDKIRWYTQHATIMTNNTMPNVTVRVLEPATAGFTVYCEITRTCPNGSIIRRTAYYTNYYGKSCSNGKTGFTATCAGSSSDILQ
jgi:hypothetical protein